jgi:hypothetical protein
MQSANSEKGNLEASAIRLGCIRMSFRFSYGPHKDKQEIIALNPSRASLG